MEWYEIKELDALGRLVIPVGIRRRLGITHSEPLEFYVDGDQLVINRYVPSCVFCGFPGEMTRFREKWVCRSCREDINNMYAFANAVDRLRVSVIRR
ncbi:hypothetical protein GCM10025857_02990 [Alicyclobacillus contaminans]|uniref:AbrB/MazE/SpoVT family DNA-binding domain-containing protein n=1 Tax=Alicyclobacillus contaminans TaxID=392016 RepID=UPI00047B3999|nr:AbrB/MazE/SpoVT family DNA-binding domain-containing protein [Alicyclobacillus contaminans]GMA48942.1 hypothetical protein GCM10025857_02990 [Alicyclobacillus contaminans]